ncbi:amino acid ABC transporter permease [Oleidesulfovibrio alaskensis]|jgi:polar amino acid transport system permease protein|uniref:amino acid ABC transporter permease n=1 Tax=Oleidesulfovibrio alaskensis TaxID=58180 RepID=UPI001A4199D6|nr:amino acid ABC transporter permease [Oleidesulfovibrio alaskensis]MBL3582076.1 amino acid ABC transporter permease [Oleidesulfovibrio alaskensis]
MNPMPAAVPEERAVECDGSMPRDAAATARCRVRLPVRIWRAVTDARRPWAVDMMLYLAVMTGVVWFTLRGTEQLGYHWQWHRALRYLADTRGGWHAGPLLQGLLVTFKVSAVSLVLAAVIGLAAVLLRLSRSVVGRALAVCYLETVRNTPLLIQLFVMYFVVAPLTGMDRFFSAVLALSLFEGAYISEIIRAGIQAVPAGQWEAARSLGLTRAATYRKVVLPQALGHVLPPLTGQMVTLVKDSALVSTIAIYDLTMQAQAIIAETFLVFEIWFMVAAMYLVVTLSLSLLAQRLECRLRTGSKACRKAAA